MDWNALLETVLKVIISAAVPVLLGLLFKWIGLQKARLDDLLDENIRDIINEAVRIAVMAAEQSGLADLIGEQYKGKKEFALDVAEKYLAQYGITLDLDVLANLIEAEVWDFLNHNKLQVG